MQFFVNLRGTLLRGLLSRVQPNVCGKLNFLYAFLFISQLAYNLGCEEQLCPMCMSEVLNGNFYAEAVGSYTWFATASRQFHHSKITNANKNTVTQHEKPFSSEERKFLSSPCTMKRSEASHALTRCRRCNYETAFDLDVLDCSLSDTSYEHLNMSFSTFIESFCHTSDLQSNVLSFLDQWPEENCFRHCPSTARSQVVLLLATIARIERCVCLVVQTRTHSKACAIIN